MEQLCMFTLKIVFLGSKNYFVDKFLTPVDLYVDLYQMQQSTGVL